MDTLITLLKKKVYDAVMAAFEGIEVKEEDIDIAPCLVEEFGHYQCNSSFKLAKVFKESPYVIAEKTASHLDERTLDRKSTMILQKRAIKGFLNITLSPSFLSDELSKVLSDPHLGGKTSRKDEKIVVEFSSPNIAKELHVGHLRSTIIGDCLARLFEFLDQEVIRLNHIGDWGTQFGMLIAYLKEKQEDVILGKEKADLSTLTQWYKEAKKLFDENVVFKKRAQEEVVRLQKGEKEAKRIWQIICDISRRAFEEIYDILDVKIIERGESFYNAFLPEVVADLEKKGLIEVSDGAKCVFLEGFKNREGNPLPIIVQKSDGGYNYDTTEIAAFRQRIEEEKADRIIVVTDIGQSLHFAMIYALVVKAGYLDPAKVGFDHVTFGLVLDTEGKKFKTREGEAEKLIDLLKNAIAHAKKVLIERLPSVSMEEIELLAQILGIDAVKYADLSCNRQKDYIFNYDKMLSLEGNTAAFLLYSYVRINGIKRKIRKDIKKVLKRAKIELKHPSEVALGLHLRRFGEIIEMVARDLLPNRLADYLYELAEKFNAFFRDCRVEGTPEEEERLVLCEVTARILEGGLNILGLRTMERM